MSWETQQNQAEYQTLLNRLTRSDTESARLGKRIADLESSVASLQEQLLVYQQMFRTVTDKIEELENRLGGE